MGCVWHQVLMYKWGLMLYETLIPMLSKVLKPYTLFHICIVSWKPCCIGTLSSLPNPRGQVISVLEPRKHIVQVRFLQEMLFYYFIVLVSDLRPEL